MKALSPTILSPSFANKILDFIDKTISSIDIELSDSENSIEAFKRTNKIISPDQAITDVTTDYKNYQNQLLLVVD
jgi:uncharacterized protein involved in exopolysaccharide biosynthesis